jgi:DNA-binding response OmpR family regulator
VEVPETAGSLLVVDDEPFLRDAVAASLRFLGFEVTAAETGADALRLARGRPFDLVVLDVMLPDTDGFEVRRDGHLIELSPTEFRLLRYLMLHPGRVLTRAQLLDHVWDYGGHGSTTVVATYVAYLRRKLARFGPDLIHTQRAVGYSLRPPWGTACGRRGPGKPVPAEAPPGVPPGVTPGPD